MRCKQNLHFLILYHKCHLFSLTETILEDTSPVGQYPGYNFIRHSLPSGRRQRTKSCGCVGWYVRKGINVTPFIESTPDISEPIASRIEYLVVLVMIDELNYVGRCVVRIRSSALCPTFRFSSTRRLRVKLRFARR